MPRKMAVDGEALLKMAEEGVDQAEIMTRFGFKTITQLKVALANAAMERGALPKLKGGRQRIREVSRLVRVNARGSLVLPKPLVASLGIATEEEFLVSATPAGLMLERTGQVPSVE